MVGVTLVVSVVVMTVSKEIVMVVVLGLLFVELASVVKLMRGCRREVQAGRGHTTSSPQLLHLGLP